MQDLEAIHVTLLDAYKLALKASGIDLATLIMDHLPTEHLPIE